MFGNLPGWCIAAVLLVLTGGLLFLKGRAVAYEPQAPTGALKSMLAKADLPIDPASVVPKGPDTTDGGAQYRAFAEQFDAAKYAAWQAADRAANAAASEAKPKAEVDKRRAESKRLAAGLDPAFDTLLAAARCGDATLFPDPAPLVNYSSVDNKPVLPKLIKGGDAALNYALWIRESNPSRAKDLRTAAFHLGRCMYRERAIWKEYEAGLDLMANAATGLARMADDAGTKANLTAFVEKCTDTKGTFAAAVMSGFYSIGTGDTPYRAAGDVILVARTSPEPMWQTQALLRLGVLKGAAGVTGLDQQYMSDLIKEMANKPGQPANVKAAAVAADNITPTDRQRSANQY